MTVGKVKLQIRIDWRGIRSQEELDVHLLTLEPILTGQFELNAGRTVSAKVAVKLDDCLW